jgi:hypothetical protein
MKGQSTFWLFTIHYGRHAQGTGKSETHTGYFVGITDSDDVDVCGNVTFKTSFRRRMSWSEPEQSVSLYIAVIHDC